MSAIILSIIFPLFTGLSSLAFIEFSAKKTVIPAREEMKNLKKQQSKDAVKFIKKKQNSARDARLEKQGEQEESTVHVILLNERYTAHGRAR